MTIKYDLVRRTDEPTSKIVKNTVANSPHKKCRRYEENRKSILPYHEKEKHNIVPPSTPRKRETYTYSLAHPENQMMSLKIIIRRNVYLYNAKKITQCLLVSSATEKQKKETKHTLPPHKEEK